MRALARCHGWPLGLLALIVAAFYAPFLLAGTAQWDAIEVHYSAQRFLSESIRSGRLPFWTPYVFTGFPLLSDLQTGAWYPLNWPFFLIGVSPDTMNVELALHAFIACVGAYALTFRLTMSRPASIAAALLYGLSGYFAGHSQHVGMVQTAAWLPWLVLLLDSLAHRVTPRRLALAGLLGALIALAGAFQIALYTFAFVAVWAVVEAIVERSRQRVLGFGLGLLAVAAWGAALAAVMIGPGLELVRQSIRTQLDASQVGLGYFQLEDLWTLVQPNYYGVLLDSRYTGPGDVTQHYLYASILLVPLALMGARHTRTLRLALALSLPFIWYALGPGTGLFDLIAQLPGFKNVELPMHGWFLPALGLALLGGAGVAYLERRFHWPGPALLALILFIAVDLIIFNSVQNRLTFARDTAENLYLAPLRAFDAERQAATPRVERLAGAIMASVAYRNHALQSHLETTYGYNPLELTRFADYIQAAQDNPRLYDGLAATHWLDGDGSLRPQPHALPLASFARATTWLPDPAATRAALDDLDPATQTIALGPPQAVENDPLAMVQVTERADDHVVLHYQSRTPNLVRLASPMYPGWRAIRDATEDLPIVTVDHALIGVLVPPGEGEIRVSYAPRYFWPAAAISGLIALVTLAVLAGAANRFAGTR